MTTTIRERQRYADLAQQHLLEAELAEWRPGMPWPAKVALEIKDACRCCREAGLDPDAICRDIVANETPEYQALEIASRLRRALWEAKL